jgi:hypothetical protein
LVVEAWFEFASLVKPSLLHTRMTLQIIQEMKSSYLNLRPALELLITYLSNPQ